MTTLGQMTEGSIVHIREGGCYEDFYVSKHNYESRLNGEGLTLLVRKELHSIMQWDSHNFNKYSESDIRNWLIGAYYNSLDANIRGVMRKTSYYYCRGNQDLSVIEGQDYVFLLSVTELGLPVSPVLGSALPKASKLLGKLYVNGVQAPQWTRSIDPNQNYSEGWKVYFVEYRSGDRAVSLIANTEAAKKAGVRPAFTLPSSLKVDDGYFVLNTAPAISGSSYSGSDLGERSAPFNFTYSVSDADNDSVTVYEYLDNVLQRSYAATLGATNTFHATSDAGTFQKILNGSHIIKVIATDSMGNSSAAYTVSFNKQVRTAAITLSSPLSADDLIKAAVINVTGNIPQDATLQVLVTNNALDASPVWEDMTQDFEKQINHVFSNKTATNGFAFNFKVTATRGVSEQQGYISNIGGAFE